MNDYHANELPPDYIEGKIDSIKSEEIDVIILNDKSSNYIVGEKVILDFSYLLDDEGRSFSASKIADYMSQFKEGERISVDFSVGDTYETNNQRLIKIERPTYVNILD